MRKRNRLYTANRWNAPLFRDNLFDAGGNLLTWDNLASQAYGADYGEKGKTLEDYMNSRNILGISKIDNPFSKGNLSKLTTSPTLGAIGSTVGNVGYGLLSGGLSSGAGKAINGVGNAVGDIVSTVNPLLGAGVKGASGLIGGGLNALFGMKTDQEKLNRANEGTNYLNTFNSNASTFEDVQGPQAMANVEDAYKGGLFNKGKARRLNTELRERREMAELRANRSVDNNIDNISQNQMDTLLANYAAFGGPLDTSDHQGAVDYGFMTDYLVAKNKQADNKNKLTNTFFGDIPSPLGFYALGGDIQSNGADFSTGLTEINAGGSHEENPYDGVQVGISRENGQPNLVEEGETIFDDYVFSNRIKMDKAAKSRFRVGNKTDITYAGLSKKLQKESEERPNDAISQQGFTKQMHDLAEEQERQKSEEQTKKVRDMFESLPPEQQAEIMQQVAQEQQAAQQQEAQQSGIQEQPAEQPMAEQQMGQPMQEDEGQMNACGGKLNRYDKGGELKKNFYNLLGFHTDSDFDKWLWDNKVDKITDWDHVLENKAFLDAVGAKNPIAADAIARGYDFGTYTPQRSRYNLKKFNEALDAYAGSKVKGNTEGNYAVDPNFNLGKYKTAQEYEANPDYKAYTDYLVDAIQRNKGIQWKYDGDTPSYEKIVWKDPNRKISKEDFDILQTLQHHINGTSVNPEGTVPLMTQRDAEGYSGLANNADTLLTRYRNDGKLGIFHMTPEAVEPLKETTNYVVDENNNIEKIIGDVPKDWQFLRDYSWSNDQGDYNARYYRKPTANETPQEEEERGVVPVHKSTWGRYAGLAGPLVGLGMQALGVGKPNYSGLNASLDILNGSPVLAQYKPIGDYLTYRPMDIWYEQNRMNANSRATDRAILNNSSPLGTKMAGLLANGYNSQIASGDLYRKALEYNDAQRQKVAEFNRGTNMYNADAFTKTSATNAEIQNRNRQLRAQMTMDAAQRRMAADAAWNQGIYSNVNSFFQGLGAWGKENAQHNMIADMAADGIFGNMSDKQHIGKGFLTTIPKQSAKGGKLNRRKGLTF